MKAILEFELPEDSAEYKHAQQGSDYHAALWDVAQEVFRPARKHGYPDERITTLLEQCGPGSHGEELVAALEEMFYSILSGYGINLDQ